VPNCKKLGLLDASGGWLRERFTEIGVIQFENWVDTGEEYDQLDEVAKDREPARAWSATPRLVSSVSPTLESVREPVATQPDEPGWWTASDGKWYPPETTPAWTPPRSAQPLRARIGRPPRSLLLVAVLAGLLAGLACFGWDLSTVDRHLVRYPNPSATELALRFGALAVLAALAVTVARWRSADAWIALGMVFAAGVVGWYLWRGSVARVDGANLAFAGAVMVAGYLAGVEAAVAALVGAVIARRAQRHAEAHDPTGDVT
jgi:hypothetical protein